MTTTSLPIDATGNAMVLNGCGTAGIQSTKRKGARLMNRLRPMAIRRLVPFFVPTGGCGAAAAPHMAVHQRRHRDTRRSSPQANRFTGRGTSRLVGFSMCARSPGRIHAIAAAGDTADIEGQSRGPKGSATLPIRLVENERGVEVRAEWPHDGCDCDSSHADTIVDFVVRVPAGVRLIAHAVNGPVDTDGLKGPIDARTVNGSIHAALPSEDSGDTVYLSDQWNGSGIDVSMSASTNAQLAAHTVSGDVRVDFPIDGVIGSRIVRGTIGHGGRELRLRTVSGAIHVVRAS